jgi:hypothetical protein
MEGYQQQPTSNQSLFALNVDAGTSQSLNSAASWAKILAICGFVMGAFCVVLGFFIRKVMEKSAAVSNGYSDEVNQDSVQIASAMGLIVYIIIGAVFVVSSLFALNFSNRIARALRNNDQQSLATGFSAVRNYFALWAILMIISLLFSIMGMAGLAVAGSMGR